MADALRERPFDNFRTAITDPRYFIGRRAVLDALCHSPFQVRVLLGGRRLGKTSVLRAAERTMLYPDYGTPRRAFAVYVDLQLVQPQDPDNLRYLLIARLREAMSRWEQTPQAALAVAEMYRQFLSRVAGVEVTLHFFAQLDVKVNLNNPAERRLDHQDFRRALLKPLSDLQGWGFTGVCFLLDEAEFVVREEWANDAWSYFRGLKDGDDALKSRLGLVLSGYRDLKHYRQRVGSPLAGIAEDRWLDPLTEAEARDLITQRSADENAIVHVPDVAAIVALGGCHTFLTQQLLNVVLDDRRAERARAQEDLARVTMQQLDQVFAHWWNEDDQTDGLGDDERTVYSALVAQREGTAGTLRPATGLSHNRVKNALDVLTGTGVVRCFDETRYAIGAQLFERWVAQQLP
jgi:hypothetical protein